MKLREWKIPIFLITYRYLIIAIVRSHGGLSLKEVPGWVKTKGEIEDKGFEVIQWHRDEVKSDVKGWIKAKGVRYPVVLAGTQPGVADDLRVVADTKELASCAGDATKLVEILTSKGVLQGTSNL